ncbi:hypothetical protein [Streptomyces olivochromogenes]|uniref:Uncharacterized protein n=1 Tax=Streptomyces olivochromogenes TaxID=1963 RepID=A0A250VL25_STROL|nr:hypothetical protein [Streptomyces olivochromogenes]GAX54752.1 hypothetical protein SO3561_06305 [Streptomyces olivochromogenes]
MSGTNTSRLVLYKPNAADDINVGTDLNANLDSIDLNSNYRVCTSSTRPSSPYVGQSILETDTGKILFRTNSSTWQEIFTAGTQISLNNTNNATLGSTGHAFQIGPTSGVNLIADNDSLVARNNGAASALVLNGTGGNLTVGASGSTVTIAGTLIVAGQYQPVIVQKTSDTARNTNTFADDPALTVSLAASAKYIVEIHIMYGTTDTARIKTQWTVPSGATGTRFAEGADQGVILSSTSAGGTGRHGAHNYTTAVQYGGRNDNTLFCAAHETALVTTTSSGTLALSWAQQTTTAGSTQAAVVAGGSWMRVQRIA